MENLIFFQHNQVQKNVSLWSIDTAAIVHLLRGNTFRIKEMVSNNSDNKLGYIRKPEDAHWVKEGAESHAHELQWFIEDCDRNYVLECIIELENGCEIEQVAGQLFVSYQNPSQIKTGIIELLKYYGFFAAEKIWDYVIQFNKSIPIDSLQGIEPNDLTLKKLDSALKLAENIEAKHIEYEKLSREMDDSEGTMPF